MAVTRIRNNQITDSSAGNTIVGINAGTKLQNYSITATKIANNLTYGSDLTVTGNLTVQGATTAIDTTTTTIEDPLLLLASQQTGAPTVDIGFIGERGSSDNIAFVWDESAGEFVTAFTSTTDSNTTITVSSYTPLHTGNLLVGGTTSLAGNVIGTANFTGNVNAGNLSTNGTLNAASLTGTNISVSGTVTAASVVGGVMTGSSISVTGTATAASTVGGVITGSSVSVTGNVTGGNLVSATVTNPTAMSVSTNAGNINLSPAGNIVLNNTYINGLQLSPVLDGDAASKFYVDQLVTTAISYHEAVVAATTGNLDAATGGTVTYAQPNGAANGVGATLTTTGSFTTIDSANVQTVGTRILVKDQANAVQNGVYVYSNATVITRASTEDTYGAATANALSINDYFFVSSGNVNLGSAWIVDSPAGVITFGTSNILFAQFSQSQVYSANTSAGLILVGQTFSAKVDNNTTAFDGGGNISVKVSANLTTPNIGAATGTSLSVTGAVTAASTVGGIITGSSVSVTGAVTAASTVGGIITGSTASLTGNINGSNLILSSGFIDGPAAGRITINGSDLDTDFAVDGDTLANVFYVDAGTGTASFGASTQVTNAIVNFATTTSVKMPVGNTVQRPGTGVTGMLRFNTSSNALEVYDNSEWTDVGVPVFTVIDDEQFAGDGSTVAFTLGSTQTTNSCIVSINGVVQIPTLAYSVSGTDPTCVLTFTEAPAAGDVIDVREVTTTTTVTQISNSGGNAIVAANPTAANVDVTGNMIISGTVSASGFVGLDATKISNGTSEVAVVASGGNIRANVAGTTVQTISAGLVAVTGNINPTANVTYDLGTTTNRWKDIWLANSTIYMGNAQISANATSLVFTNPQGGQTVLAGTSSAITGATVSVTGNISTASNVVIGSAANSAIFNSNVNLEIQNTVSTGNINFRANVNGGGDQNVFRILGTGGVGVVGNLISLSANGAVANGASNIGSASGTFNTIFAKATSAQYADLAEKYAADADYAPGTVVMFGGGAEVTICSNDGCTRVAGVVSTNPSYRMNDGLQSAHTAMVALTGRVPTSVTGTVRKGDMMVSAGNGTARSEANPKVGTVIGKALADSQGDAVIEVVVGRV